MRAAYHGWRESYPGLIDELLHNTPSMISVDIETPDLEDKTIVGVGIGLNEQEAMYFPVVPERSPWLWTILEWLNNPNIVKIYHNGLFDMPALEEQLGVSIDLPVIDTMIMAQLAGYPLKLAELGNIFQVPAQDMKEVLAAHKTKTTLELPEGVLAKKCCLDCQATWAAYNRLVNKVDMGYIKREMELIPILIRMQRVGLKVDHEYRKRLVDVLLTEASWWKELCKVEGFNPASYKQVGKTLAGRTRQYPKNRKVLVWKNGKQTYGTDEKILSTLDDPLAAYTLVYREVAKQESTYVRPLAELDRIYTHFSFDTDTRRLASKDRALQNWPKHLRAVLVPDSEAFLSMDYSQQELRVLAYVSGDKALNEAFESGKDIHATTASIMFSKPLDLIGKAERQMGKTGNFAVIYGSKDKKLEPVMDMWFGAFKEARDWIYDIQQFALQHMKVPTVGGAWLYIRDEGDIEAVKRKAVDYVCQGSAAELTKEAMRRCKDLPLVLQIHDELVFSYDVRDRLEKLELDWVGPFRTPVEYRLMERWG